ncbi:MAG: ribonuclease [Deltaproteobacteria bacterium]|nr:ribonuclease [Deltaproteobacteria bacterium]
MRKLKLNLAFHRKECFRFKCLEAWDVFREARRAFLMDGCLNLSAAMTFYAILSLTPFLLLLISGTAYILGSSESGLKMALSFSSQFFPHAGSLIFEEVGAISRRAEVFGLLGVLSMLWTASVLFSSLGHAMAVVFRVPQRRDFLKARLLALSMVPAFALFFLLSFSVTALSGCLREMETILWGFDLAKWSYLEFLTGYHFPYLVLTLGFTVVYKIIPNTPVSFHHALAGGASCAFLFEVAKHSFAWYFKDYGRYGATCGPLDAMIILVLWIFFSACILLFCAELISAYRRRHMTLLAHAFK